VENFIPGVHDFVAGLDETNATALAIGVGSLALILGLRRVAPKVSGVFLAVVGATAVVAALALADQVPVVGTVPEGLPAFGMPDVSFDDVKTLIPAAVGIAFVAFTDTSVLSRSYAGRLRQEVDQNQELAVLGVANIATGFFQGFPISTSSSAHRCRRHHDTERYPDARRIPGLVLYRFDAPLFFANADYFRERIRALARSGDVNWIVVAAEPITDVDATAGETLGGLNDELDAAGIELSFAELKDPVRDRLRRYGILEAIGDDRFFPTVGVAVAAYFRETGVHWLDWEDRRPGHPAHPGQ
jgi:MFS superfamily sulfate permease-like transporter